jgi:hypothetical protein
VKSSLKKVLTRKLKGILDFHTDAVVKEILEEAIEKAKHRINFYAEQLGKFWNHCKISLENQFRGETHFQKRKMNCSTD